MTPTAAAVLSVLLSLRFLAAAVPSLSPREAWSHFLKDPTAANYYRIVKTVAHCHEAACRDKVGPDDEQVHRLIALVEDARGRAPDVALISLNFLDGGDLEDVMRSLGILADTKPRMFLEKVKRHKVPSTLVGRIVTMLPEVTIDDDAGRRAAIRKRIRALSVVDDSGLNALRDEAVDELRALLQSAHP